MKTVRWFTIILLAILVVSTWAPAPAYAKPSRTTSLVSDYAKKTKLAKLRVNNRTGGALYVRFSGPRNYSFGTSTQGRTTFATIIQPGKYVITVTSSACGGSLTYRKNVKGGTVSLPPIICKHKKKK